MSKPKELLSITKLCERLKSVFEKTAAIEKEERSKRSQCNWTTMRYAGENFMRKVFDIGQALEMKRIQRKDLQLKRTLEEVNSKLLGSSEFEVIIV
ncbi:hypothetical protein [Baaleninema simplex]|uniref:hypothetical protein n=1 Tax=Baaleninema simplex TaxID=2862350 RepID=UPI0003778BA5|nr:hypothetical protein [Baaleninema simplex]